MEGDAAECRAGFWIWEVMDGLGKTIAAIELNKVVAEVRFSFPFVVFCFVWGLD